MCPHLKKATKSVLPVFTSTTSSKQLSAKAEVAYIVRLARSRTWTGRPMIPVSVFFLKMIHSSLVMKRSSSTPRPAPHWCFVSKWAEQRDCISQSAFVGGVAFYVYKKKQNARPRGPGMLSLPTISRNASTVAATADQCMSPESSVNGATNPLSEQVKNVQVKMQKSAASNYVEMDD